VDEVGCSLVEETEGDGGEGVDLFAGDVYDVKVFDSTVASAVLGNIPAELIVSSRLAQLCPSGNTAVEFDFAAAAERVFAGLRESVRRRDAFDLSLRVVFDPRLFREIGCLRGDVGLVLVDFNCVDP
jgi:hypothetical protein